MSYEGIFANLAFAIPLGLFMLLLFIYCRSAFPLFYHRNLLCHGKAVYGVKVEKSFFGWFKGLLGISDDSLLRLAGLDALVTSNGFRLILLFILMMIVPCLLILLPFYYSHSDRSEVVNFATFTISELYTETFWPPLLVLMFLSALVLYGVYAFYSNFIRMRQAYLLRPSGLSSLGAMLKTAESLGSIKYARRRPDAAICTVLLHPIPSDIGSSPEKLKEILKNSGVTGIKSVQFIGNYRKLKEILEKRNSSMKKLENALKTVCDKLEISEKIVLEMSKKITVKKRSELLQKLISDVSFCSAFRPKHKTSSPASTDPEPLNSDGSVDSLRHYYKKLMEREEKLQDAIKEFNIFESERSEIEQQSEPTADEDFEERYIEETTFISWKKVCDLAANVSYVMSLTSSQAALVHFSDYRSATRANQILITSRPNTLISSMAPSPDDLNWSCIEWSEHQRLMGALKSNLFYWGFVILFTPVSAAIVELVDMEGLGKWFEVIETFRQNHPMFKEILQSVIAPFLATFILKKTGVWINKIISLRGPLSKSELLLRTQSAHLFFLFTQLILIGGIFSNVYKLTTSNLVKSGQETFLRHIRENIPKKAHFFFNFMIQDIFIELMLELLNPKSLLLDRSFLRDSSRKIKNIRNLFVHDTTPPELDLAIIWSRFIMFPFFVFMTYVIIAPLIVIPAMAYFSVAYVVYRFRFAEYGRRSTETGGLYWRQCSQQIIYGLILAQLSVLLQYTQFREGFLPSLILLMMLCLTVLFIPLLKHIFGRGCENLSILEDEMKTSKKFVQSFLYGQNKLIPGAINNLDNSEIIKSKLDSDLGEHVNFSDIDSIVAPDNQMQPKSGIFISNQDKSLFEPYWELIPLVSKHVTEDESATFDQYQVDSLVDTVYIIKQYEHPLILKHHQSLMVPSNLLFLLEKEVEKQVNNK